MASEDPIFDFSIRRWPPITRYKKKKSQETLTADKPGAPSRDPATDPPLANLVQQETTPAPEAAQSPLRPASPSSESISSVPLMNPYPITFPAVTLPELVPPPPLQPASPAPFLGVFQQVRPAPSSPTPPLVGTPVQQFGVTPSFPNYTLSNSFPSATLPPSSWSPVSSQFSSVMGGSIGAAVRGDFPPLHSLPPTFWDPVIRLPEPDPAPPMHTPQAPSLANLASRSDGKGENFSDDSLKAIIIKAQPHHNNQSLAHLNRQQLVKHVDDLIQWWKIANPHQANRAQQANVAQLQFQQPQQQPAQQQSLAQVRHEQRLLANGLPPLTPAVQESVASAAASARAQEKVIGQCPCCCENQQNAAFSPCGHLYACTRCAYRVYDGGRGKCPVCRVPIQTYLKIYPTG